MKLPRPGPVMARAIATGLPYFARNVQTDEQFDPEARALFRQENIESILISSLQHGESYNGAIAIYPAGDREFTPAELSVFQSFSDLATMAVAVRNLMGHQREIAVMEEGFKFWHGAGHESTILTDRIAAHRRFAALHKILEEIDQDFFCIGFGHG